MAGVEKREMDTTTFESLKQGRLIYLDPGSKDSEASLDAMEKGVQTLLSCMHTADSAIICDFLKKDFNISCFFLKGTGLNVNWNRDLLPEEQVNPSMEPLLDSLKQLMTKIAENPQYFHAFIQNFMGDDGWYSKDKDLPFFALLSKTLGQTIEIGDRFALLVSLAVSWKLPALTQAINSTTQFMLYGATRDFRGHQRISGNWGGFILSFTLLEGGAQIEDQIRQLEQFHNKDASGRGVLLLIKSKKLWSWRILLAHYSLTTAPIYFYILVQQLINTSGVESLIGGLDEILSIFVEFLDRIPLTERTQHLQLFVENLSTALSQVGMQEELKTIIVSLLHKDHMVWFVPHLAEVVNAEELKIRIQTQLPRVKDGTTDNMSLLQKLLVNTAILWCSPMSREEAQSGVIVARGVPAFVKSIVNSTPALDLGAVYAVSCEQFAEHVIALFCATESELDAEALMRWFGSVVMGWDPTLQEKFAGVWIRTVNRKLTDRGCILIQGVKQKLVATAAPQTNLSERIFPKFEDLDDQVSILELAVFLELEFVQYLNLFFSIQPKDDFRLWTDVNFEWLLSKLKRAQPEEGAGVARILRMLWTYVSNLFVIKRGESTLPLMGQLLDFMFTWAKLAKSESMQLVEVLSWKQLQQDHFLQLRQNPVLLQKLATFVAEYLQCRDATLSWGFERVPARVIGVIMELVGDHHPIVLQALCTVSSEQWQANAAVLELLVLKSAMIRAHLLALTILMQERLTLASTFLKSQGELRSLVRQAALPVERSAEGASALFLSPAVLGASDALTAIVDDTESNQTACAYLVHFFDQSLRAIATIEDFLSWARHLSVMWRAWLAGSTPAVRSVHQAIFCRELGQILETGSLADKKAEILLRPEMAEPGLAAFLFPVLLPIVQADTAQHAQIFGWLRDIIAQAGVEHLAELCVVVETIMHNEELQKYLPGYFDVADKTWAELVSVPSHENGEKLSEIYMGLIAHLMQMMERLIRQAEEVDQLWLNYLLCRIVESRLFSVAVKLFCADQVVELLAAAFNPALSFRRLVVPIVALQSLVLVVIDESSLRALICHLSDVDFALYVRPLNILRLELWRLEHKQEELEQAYRDCESVFKSGSTVRADQVLIQNRQNAVKVQIDFLSSCHSRPLPTFGCRAFVVEAEWLAVRETLVFKHLLMGRVLELDTSIADEIRYWGMKFRIALHGIEAPEALQEALRALFAELKKERAAQTPGWLDYWLNSIIPVIQNGLSHDDRAKRNLVEVARNADALVGSFDLSMACGILTLMQAQSEPFKALLDEDGAKFGVRAKGSYVKEAMLKCMNRSMTVQDLSVLEKSVEALLSYPPLVMYKEPLQDFLEATLKLVVQANREHAIVLEKVLYTILTTTALFDPVSAKKAQDTLLDFIFEVMNAGLFVSKVDLVVLKPLIGIAMGFPGFDERLLGVDVEEFVVKWGSLNCNAVVIKRMQLAMTQLDTEIGEKSSGVKSWLTTAAQMQKLKNLRQCAERVLVSLQSRVSTEAPTEAAAGAATQPGLALLWQETAAEIARAGTGEAKASMATRVEDKSAEDFGMRGGPGDDEL